MATWTELLRIPLNGGGIRVPVQWQLPHADENIETRICQRWEVRHCTQSLAHSVHVEAVHDLEPGQMVGINSKGSNEVTARLVAPYFTPAHWRLF